VGFAGLRPLCSTTAPRIVVDSEDGASSFRRVCRDDPDERLAALAAFANKILSGRWDEVRAPNANELKGTMILAMEIEQAAAKVRHGPPDDDDGE
jgi:Pyridoxamine 5'-phosphate oxidase